MQEGNDVERWSRRRRPGRPVLVGMTLLAALVVASLGASAASVAPGLKGGPVSDGNPAAIGVQMPTVRLTLTPLDLSFGNNTWPLAQLDSHLDKYLPVEVRRQFIQDIPDGIFRLTGRAAAGLQLGIGPFSAAVGVRAVTGGAMADDVLTLLLLGNELDVPYSLAGTAAEAAFLGDASAGLSVSVGDALRVGVRYHQLYGLAYGRVTADGEFVVSSVDPSLHGYGSIAYAYTSIQPGAAHPAGDGWAVDVGVAYQVRPDLAVGAALLDWGEVRWDAVTSRVCQVTPGVYGPDASWEDMVDCGPEATQAYTWQLPGRYEVSVGWQATDKLHVGAAYGHSVRVVAAPSAVHGGDFRVGVTWDVFRFLQLNASATVSSGDGVAVAAGAALRLGPVLTSVRASNVQALFGHGQGKSMVFGVDMGIVF